MRRPGRTRAPIAELSHVSALIEQHCYQLEAPIERVTGLGYSMSDLDYFVIPARMAESIRRVLGQ